MTFAVFHDYPGLEYGLPKFHDFPGPVVSLRERRGKEGRKGEGKGKGRREISPHGHF